MKRLLIFLLVLVFCLPPAALAAAPTQSYIDVSPEDWYYEGVEYVTRRDLMNGVGNGYFQPQLPLTRVMAVTLLHRLAGEPTTDLQTSFADVPVSHYASQSIRWACEAGITNGKDDSLFRPNDPISREQAVTLLYRYALCRYLRPDSAEADTDFSDEADIASYAVDAVSWAAAAGIVDDQAETFFPNSTVSRGDMADMLMRFQQWAEDQGSNDLLPGESIFLLGKSVRAVQIDGGLYVPATDASSGTMASYLTDLSGCLYVSLDYYTEVLGYVEGVTPDGTRYVAQLDPLVLPEAGTPVPVLMYHAVSDDVWGLEGLFVGPAAMEEQLQYLVENGYDPIWFEDLAHLEQYDKPVILTFDDGYLDNYTNLYPLLQKYQVKATFFIIGQSIGRVNKINRTQLYELSHSGLVSIQSHTYTHDMLTLKNADQQAYEMEASRDILAAYTGFVPQVLCYPGGAYNQLTLSVAPNFYAFGLKWDGGMYTTGDDPHQVNRFYVERTTDPETFRGFLEHDD